MTEFHDSCGLLGFETAHEISLPSRLHPIKRSERVRQCLSSSRMVGEGATVILNGEQLTVPDLERALGTVTLTNVLPLGRRHLIQAGKQLDDIYRRPNGLSY